MSVAASACNRLHGLSVRDCACRLPDGKGWLTCPPEARKPLPKLDAAPRTGDECADCGSMQMVRGGTCLLCLNCGSTSGGCS